MEKLWTPITRLAARRRMNCATTAWLAKIPTKIHIFPDDSSYLDIGAVQQGMIDKEWKAVGFQHILMAYGYTGVFVLLGLEYLILIVPGETLLTTLGILAQTHKIHLHLWLLVIAATLGTFAGSIATYWLGRAVGRPFILRYGKYVFLTEARLQKTERLFRRSALPTIIVTKYIAVIRDLVPYVAGIQRIRMRTYLTAQLIASLAWTSTFLLTGSFLEKAGQSLYHHWRIECIPAAVLLAALVFAYRAFHKRLDRFVNRDGDMPNHDISINK